MVPQAAGVSPKGVGLHCPLLTHPQQTVLELTNFVPDEHMHSTLADSADEKLLPQTFVTTGVGLHCPLSTHPQHT